MLVLLCAVLCVYIPAWSQECPGFTKRDAVSGVVSQVPQGWFYYCKNNETGVYGSPIRTFSEQAISNTQNEYIEHVDISNNGKWLLYISLEEDEGTEEGDVSVNNRTYLIRTDGTGKTEVPCRRNDVFGNGFSPNFIGFYRSSPFENELFWITRNVWIYAMKVHLPDSGEATFDSTRILVDLSRTNDASIPFWNVPFAVAGDQVFGIFYRTLPEVWRFTAPHYITIPREGKGIATLDDFYPYRNFRESPEAPGGSYWGCGFSCSFDGSLWVANAGWVGPPCVPNKKSLGADDKPLDHKGFYITKFLRKDDPPLEIDSVMVDPEAGVSINWAPLRFHHGEYNEVDFNQWAFTNHNSWIIGSLKGSDAGPETGIWIVHWPSNYWTRITPAFPQGERDYPVAFFTKEVIDPDIDSIWIDNGVRDAGEPGTPQQMPLVRRMVGNQVWVWQDPGVSRVQFFSTSGRLVWEHTRTAGTMQRLRLPPHLAAGNVLMARYIRK